MKVKKYFALSVIFLFFSVSIIPSSGIIVEKQFTTNSDFTNDTTYKLNSLVTSNEGPTCLTSSDIICNRPFPPIMWTKDFETFLIADPNPNNKPIFYLIDWGDGNSSDWIGPYDSCETVEISHVWNKNGNYTIEVKSKNVFGTSKVSVYFLRLSSDIKMFSPIIGYVDITYKFIIDWMDEQGDHYFIEILWGDGTVEEWIGPYNGVFTLYFSWSSPGKYCIRIRAKDVYGAISDWLTFSITIVPMDNNAPCKPIIIGPPVGKAGVNYCFSFVTFDLDGDNVFYEIDWGDGTPTDVIGPYPSSKRIKRTHEWLEEGIFTIKCKAKDVYYAESSWMTNYIKIPRTRVISSFYWLRSFDLLPIFQRLLYIIK